MSVSNIKEPIKRLLFTEEPFADESFIGYILRLAELNEIPNIDWILEPVRPVKFMYSNYKYNIDFNINNFELSKITGTELSKLKDLLYVQASYKRKRDKNRVSFFEQNIHQDFIQRTFPRICPGCLKENGYCRKVWEVKFIQACPIHKCLLLDECPSCFYQLEWKRPKVNFCPCGFDFRTFIFIPLKNKDLQLTNYFYRSFGLPCGDYTSMLNYPLNTLEPNLLAKLLYFILAYFTKDSNYEGFISANLIGNEQTYKYFNAGVRIFDKWAVGYYKFIEVWSKRYKNHDISSELSCRQNRKLPSNYSKYESMNFILRCYFRKKDYPFLYAEFKNFLKKLPVEDTSQSYLLNDL